MTFYDDDQGFPAVRGKTQAQLDAETKDGLDRARFWLIYPVPGFAIVLQFTYWLTQWSVFLWISGIVAIIWIVAAVSDNWDKPWATAFRRGLIDWIMATIFRRPVEPPETPHPLEAEAERRAHARAAEMRGHSPMTPLADFGRRADEPSLTPLPSPRWSTDVADASHAQYRIQYEMLARKGLERSVDDELMLSQVLQGLRRFGDDPLGATLVLDAHVTTDVRPQGFISLAPAGGALSALINPWIIVPFAALLAVLGVQTARVAMAEQARDARCTDGEMLGRTQRQACRELAVSRANEQALRDEVAGLNAAVVQTTARVVESEQRTVELNEQLRAIRVRFNQRERRANARAVEDARTGAAPDWGSELSEFAEPAAVADPGGAPAPADLTPGRGVPDDSAAEGGVSPPDQPPGGDPGAA